MRRLAALSQREHQNEQHQQATQSNPAGALSRMLRAGAVRSGKVRRKRHPPFRHPALARQVLWHGPVRYVFGRSKAGEFRLDGHGDFAGEIGRYSP